MPTVATIEKKPGVRLDIFLMVDIFILLRDALFLKRIVSRLRNAGDAC